MQHGDNFHGLISLYRKKIIDMTTVPKDRMADTIIGAAGDMTTGADVGDKVGDGVVVSGLLGIEDGLRLGMDVMTAATTGAALGKLVGTGLGSALGSKVGRNCSISSSKMLSMM